jgi:poly(ADP-ribose) glycohydrolase ARH3
VALAASRVEHAADLARQCAQVTHARDDDQFGAVVQAAAVYLAL